MKKTPLFALFIAIYPVVSLFAFNIREAPIEDVFRPLLLCLLLAGILLGLSQLVFRNVRLAALISSLTFLALCSYGQIYRVLRNLQIGSLIVGRHRVLAILFVVVLMALFWSLSRIQRDKLDGVTQAVNWCSLALLILPAYQLISGAHAIHWPQAHTNPTIPAQADTAPADYPDVYYIIPDSYARADYIQQYMQYDNSSFLNALKERGFYTVECAMSNYSFTRLSLGTSLNMEYIENLGDEYVPENKDESTINHLILKSRVADEFKKLGYKTVAFNTGYGFTEVTEADYYFHNDSNPLTREVASDFERLFIDNTLLTALRGQKGFSAALGLDFPYYQKYRTQRFIIDTLQQVPNIPGPKFVFVHLVTTHRPYIFDSDGSILTEQRFYSQDGVPASQKDFIEGYQRSLDYTNTFMLDLIDQIQAKSARPPVIIIQGDHGVMEPGRLTILNTINIPGGSDQLYETETPVNTFRIVFNAIAGTNYPLLEDRSQTSNVNKAPFDFVLADNNRACEIQ